MKTILIFFFFCVIMERMLNQKTNLDDFSKALSGSVFLKKENRIKIIEAERDHKLSEKSKKEI